MLLPELGAYLIAEAVCTAAGTDLFYGSLPDVDTDRGAPINAIALYEYSGMAPETAFGMSTGMSWHLEYPFVQVRVRNGGYAAGRAKIEAAYVAFAKVANEALSGTRYLAVEVLQPPFSMGKDDLGYWHFVFNARVIKELSAS